MSPSNVGRGSSSRRPLAYALDQSLAPLPLAPEPASDGLRAAAAAVVRWQVRLDLARREDAPGGPVPRQIIGLTGSICGATLIRAVVPFVMHELALVQSGAAALVPLDLLLGDSWRWTTESVSPNDVDRLREWLSHPDRSDLMEEEAAKYVGLPALGIFWAHEGKNRVQFLRDCGNTHAPAHLTLYAYPSPERIELYRVRVVGRIELWAVLDRRWVQPILLAELGERLLREYGVAPPSRWPENWPDAASVAEELYRDVDPEWQGPFRCVDLLPLEGRRRLRVRGREKAHASVVDLEDVGLRWKYIGKLALASLALAALGRFIGSDSGGIITGIGIGFGLMLLGVISWPLLETNRRMLKPSIDDIANQEMTPLQPPCNPNSPLSSRSDNDFPD